MCIYINHRTVPLSRWTYTTNGGHSVRVIEISKKGDQTYYQHLYKHDKENKGEGYLMVCVGCMGVLCVCMGVC